MPAAERAGPPRLSYLRLVRNAQPGRPRHLHLIISSRGEALENILRDFKKHTSKSIVKLLPDINESRREWLLKAFEKAAIDLKWVRHYKVWQGGKRPILLDNKEMQEQRLNYLHQNPVEAEIVDETEYYWYSSARDYAGGKGLLEVSFIG